MSDVYLTVAEASSHINVKKSFIYSLVESKDIPHYRLGRLIRFKSVDLDNWIEKHRVEKVDSSKGIKQILRKAKGGQRDIDELVKKSIAEAKGINYTNHYGKSGQNKTGREAENGFVS